MILISTQCFPPAIGGIEQLMYDLAKQLSAAGREVAVHADQPAHPSAFEGERGAGFAVHRYGGLKPWRRRRKARKVDAQAQQDRVRAIIADSWKSLELLTFRKPMPVLCLAHGVEYPLQTRPGKRRRILKSLARATHVIANSADTAERAREFCPTPSALRIIPPGIEPPLPPDQAMAEECSALTAGRWPVLISVGRLVRYKGHRSILESMAKLHKQYPNFCYHIVGDGPEKNSLMQQTQQHRIAAQVCFHGALSDPVRKQSLLRGADLFVLPGTIDNQDVEGFGIAFIEAAAAGIPALAGIAGGGSDAVRDGHTGLLCRGDDPTDVLAKLTRLLADDALRKELGNNAEEHVKKFLWSNILPRYLGLLDQYGQAVPDAVRPPLPYA